MVHDDGEQAGALTSLDTGMQRPGAFDPRVRRAVLGQTIAGPTLLGGLITLPRLAKNAAPHLTGQRTPLSFRTSTGGVMHELQELLREYDRARAYTDELWKDLTPDEVTWRPHESSSAIGWHLGHQAHVAHFMIRNLTAAEPSPDPESDRLSRVDGYLVLNPCALTATSDRGGSLR